MVFTEPWHTFTVREDSGKTFWDKVYCERSPVSIPIFRLKSSVDNFSKISRRVFCFGARLASRSRTSSDGFFRSETTLTFFSAESSRIVPGKSDRNTELSDAQ